MKIKDIINLKVVSKNNTGGKELHHFERKNYYERKMSHVVC